MAEPTGKVLDFNNALKEKELEAYLANDFDPQRKDKILSGLNSNVESFIAWLYPAAIITPKKARVGNIHGSPGSSLVIETKGANQGLWADFADPSQKGGNLIDLFLAARGLPFGKAALDELAEWVGNGTRPEVNYAREQAVRKLKRVERDLGPQKGEWHYTDADGIIIASVYRFEPDEGKKQYLPWDATSRAYVNPDVRPLYNLPKVLQSPSVVVCEGEKSAEALIKRDIVATCVMGGSNSPLDHTDLEPLRGKEIIIWPDADVAGHKFAAGFALAVQDIADSVRIITVPEGKEQGWDAADAVDENMGFDHILGTTVTLAEAKPTLPFFWYNEAEPSLDANDFIEGLLTSGSMSVVYGPSNCGKTFFVLDLALHVAWGHEWHGKEVDKGAVVYLSLEGAQGVKNRIAAFRRHHKAEDLPLATMPKPVDLLSSEADVNAVIQLTQHIAEKSGLPVRMVIIDTLSRAMAGGNENSPEDMTALIGNCDRIRDATGSHVCIVHHSGKDEAKGARGHSSLRAATDTEIEIRRDPNLTQSSVRIAKQRDLEADEPFNFTLKSVALGTNRRGKDVTSCVVLEGDKTVVLARDENTLSAKEREAFDTLFKMVQIDAVNPETGEIEAGTGFVPLLEWKAALIEGGTLNRNNKEVARKQFDRLRNALNNKSKIKIEGVMICTSGT